jgi:hypothetical protein
LTSGLVHSAHASCVALDDYPQCEILRKEKGQKKRHPLDEITKNYGLLWKVVELQCNDRIGVREEKIRMRHYSAATVLEMNAFLLS